MVGNRVVSDMVQVPDLEERIEMIVLSSVSVETFISTNTKYP